MVYKYFDKKSVLLADKSASRGAIKNEIIYDNKLAEELHKPIIRKFEKRKVHSPSIDNIWGVDLADMQLISKFDKGFTFLTKSSSAAGRTRGRLGNTGTFPAADEDFVICRNARMDRHLRCQSNVWCVLQLMMSLIYILFMCY